MYLIVEMQSNTVDFKMLAFVTEIIYNSYATVHPRNFYRFFLIFRNTIELRTKMCILVYCTNALYLL